MLLGGECGWRSKRFPVTVAQHGWYSVSTRWRYEGKVSKLLNKYGVGVVGTLAWSTFKLYPATVAQLPNHSTYTGLAWSARWRGQRINGALLRWHNGRSNMHRASLSVVNTAHCPATTSVALMWVSAEGWLRSIYVLHTWSTSIYGRDQFAKVLNAQIMLFLCLNIGDSHQALAGMVSTLAWSTFQMMLAYIDEAGYITSRGGCAYQPDIVWLGQYAGVVSVESMFCWGIWAILLADSGGFNLSAHKWRWHGLAS